MNQFGLQTGQQVNPPRWRTLTGMGGLLSIGMSGRFGLEWPTGLNWNKWPNSSEYARKSYSAHFP